MCVYMCVCILHIYLRYINSFQTLDIKQCRAVTPESRKTNELRLVIAPAGAWREIPDYISGREHYSRAQRYP